MTETLYPALGRYFKNKTELAHAGCMSRSRLYLCLTGEKAFTRAEKKAISANIVARLMNDRPINERDLDTALTAWSGRFDEMYRRNSLNV